MRIVALVTLLLTVGCGPAVGEVRMLVRPPKPESCDLQIVEVNAADMAPGAKFGPGGELEMVGSIMIGASDGTDAMSEDIRKLVRPRACAMGGDVVSLLASGTGSNRRGVPQQNIVFTVWGKQSRAPSPPQKF